MHNALTPAHAYRAMHAGLARLACRTPPLCHFAMNLHELLVKAPAFLDIAYLRERQPGNYI